MMIGHNFHRAMGWIRGSSTGEREFEYDVIDVGSGPGLFLSILNEAGYKTMGIEYDKAYVDESKKFTNNVKVVHGDARSCKIPTSYVYYTYLPMYCTEQLSRLYINMVRQMPVGSFWIERAHHDYQFTRGYIEDAGYELKARTEKQFRRFYPEEIETLNRWDIGIIAKTGEKELTVICGWK